MNTRLGVVIPSELGYIRTPIEYHNCESENVDRLEKEQSEGLVEEVPVLKLKRDIDSEEEMLRKLIDLIVYTPRGSFHSDPDFGFEFWNHEYKNINYDNFNNGQGDNSSEDKDQKITKIECQESIKNSLLVYAPQLKNVHVEVRLEAAPNDRGVDGREDEKRRMPSKHSIFIEIHGERNDGIRDNVPFNRKVTFFIEPIAKRRVYK